MKILGCSILVIMIAATSIAFAQEEFNAQEKRFGKLVRTNVSSDAPAGYGSSFNWSREEDVTLHILINGADPRGVRIDNVKNGDRIKIVSAAGQVWFSENTGHSELASLIAVVGVAGSAYAPEYAPVIMAGSTYAKQFFTGTGNGEKARDPFGQMWGQNKWARQEGGIIICYPNAGGPLVSGDRNHKERWIPGNDYQQRTWNNVPSHVTGKGFFVAAGKVNQPIVIPSAGSMYILPWDHRFEDNAGAYELQIELIKG